MLRYGGLLVSGLKPRFIVRQCTENLDDSFARKVRLRLFRENLSRKGAKAQSAAAFLRVFFAPLREKYFFSERSHTEFGDFSGKALDDA